jgi:hypothetical protein
MLIIKVILSFKFLIDLIDFIMNYFLDFQFIKIIINLIQNVFFNYNLKLDLKIKLFD